MKPIWFVDHLFGRIDDLMVCQAMNWNLVYVIVNIRLLVNDWELLIYGVHTMYDGKNA